MGQILRLKKLQGKNWEGGIGLRMMKNVFILPLKVFSFLRYSIFCGDLQGCVEKRLDKKANVNFKIYGK